MDNERTKIAIIGAGASGLAAALQAAWRGAAVSLFESNAQVGRKLLATGSGRCNLTNVGVSAEKYTCADANWMRALLGGFGVPDLLEMLAEIGIMVTQTPDGWYYPLSNSAQTVVEAFDAAAKLAGVSLRLSSKVNAIAPARRGFSIRYAGGGGEGEEMFEKVIIAAGGMAYPTLGSRGELFPVLAQLGHTVLPKRPALAPVLVDLKDLKVLQGVRLDVRVALWHGKELLASAAGNMIFTEWGLNGPAVMDISHHVSAHPADTLIISLNLLDFFEAEFANLLARKRNTPLPVRVLLGAFLPPKVVSFYLSMANIPADAPLNKVSEGALNRLVSSLKDTRRPVKGVRGFEYCQVSAGGVPVTEVYPKTLESRRLKGLYLAGETLDVVGPCGGYNLQYAFSSGALAGRAAASRAHDD
ncbi:MAG: aminoacetone oxidase family FAD-binding enzyme [Anaerolineaceae bacterium]|nr:aminoacetone oxidase family FAD-binding enzyme [Anaerolineaceae bacterium]